MGKFIYYMFVCVVACLFPPLALVLLWLGEK